MNLWRIVQKDLTLILRDYYALLLLLGMPLVITTIVCVSANHFVSLVLEEDLHLVVVNQGRGPLAGRLVETLSGPGASVRVVESEEEVRTLVRDSNWTAGVIVGGRFDAEVEGLELGDFLNLPEGRLAEGIGRFDVEIVSGPVRILQNLFASELVQARLLQLVYARMMEKFPVVKAVAATSSSSGAGAEPEGTFLLQSRKVLSRGAMYQILIPSQAVLFAFFLVNVMARSFINERTRGTLQRLQISPVPGWVLVLGKTLPFLLMSVLQGVLLFAFGRAVFGMPTGSHPWMLLVVIFCTGLAATALGLLIAVSVSTDYQVAVLVTFLILAMSGLSGCLMPREFMPPLMRQISLYITPHAWALAAYEELLATTVPDLSRLYLSCLMLLVFALAYLSLSFWRMTRTSRLLAT